MQRLRGCLMFAAVVILSFYQSAGAQQEPEFKLGFKMLADSIPDVVGVPLENEHWGTNGDSLQVTSRGLMVWRKADNWTAFTDGARTWVNGPNGVEVRGNDERFPWEGGQQSAAQDAPTPLVVPTMTPTPTAPPAAPANITTPTPQPPGIGKVTIDGKEYLTSLTWSANGIDDPYLRGALAYAYTYAPDWRPVADIAALRRTKVLWGDLPSDQGGNYRSATNTITINSSLKREYSGVVAAILAHEAYHAASPTLSEGSDCLQKEIWAFSWQAYVWSKMPSSSSQTTSQRWQDELVGKWYRNELDDYVLLTPGYQEECLGGVGANP